MKKTLFISAVFFFFSLVSFAQQVTIYVDTSDGTWQSPETGNW